MLALLTNRLVVVSAGLTLFALFVWFAGPLFGFGIYKPLESATVRLIVIAAAVILWVAVQVVNRLRARRASDQLAAAVVNQASADQPNPEVTRLREQFEEAVHTLRQKRRDGHTLYELPWYIIIGAPGSGKTTALTNSGLHFPLEQRVGRGALRGIGGTRNCDWWFTDEAVFLDTAGRYTTQDSDAASDRAGWSEFLALLRKYRRRRPVNGVLLTISAQDLMLEGTREREAHVDAVRRRLDELYKELRVDLPVYLLVTKCDLLAGFTEYFDDLPQDGRAQVWGVTFPYEQSGAGEGPTRFPDEFEALVTRLNERLFARLEQERDPRRRGRLFGFPPQVAAIQEALSEFTAAVFSSTRFERRVLLRGVYLTSGTQEGTPIDRVLGALGRRFGVAADAVAPASGKGKAYFIERLLKDVVIAESGLAGVNRRVEATQAAVQLGVYAALLIATILGVGALSNSYSNNRTFMSAISAKAAEAAAVAPASGSLDRVLPQIDAAQAIVDVADRYVDEKSILTRGLGLDQSDSLGGAARDAYTRLLDNALVPALKVRFERRLREFGSDPEAVYAYLKAYLMLNPGGNVNVDANYLGDFADAEWGAVYSEDTKASARLAAHFRRLLKEDGLTGVSLDQSLVAQARATIQQASIPRLIYGFLKAQYANDPRVLPMLERAGIGTELVFRRKSGTPLSKPMDALYTKTVFEEITGKSTQDLAKDFAADSWVWGDERLPLTDSPDLAPRVIDIYEKDYIKAWDDYLADLELAPLSTLVQTKEALAILGRSNGSPLRGILQAVDEQTFLNKPEDPAKGATDKSIVSSVLDRVRRESPAEARRVLPGMQITQRFTPIHRLVVGGGGATLIDGLLEQIRQVQQTLEPVGTGVGQKSPDDPQTVAAIRMSADSLKREAATLPPAIGDIVKNLGERTASVSASGLRTTLENRYQQDVVRECRALIDDRYPFGAGTGQVTVADFGQVFGQGGVYDKFFKNELDPLVDTSRSPWVWRAGAGGVSVPLAKFEAAERIRQLFFSQGGTRPDVRFRMTPVELDTASDRLVIELDGRRFEYGHGAVRDWQAKWPGDGAGIAAITFQESGGGGPNRVFEGAWAFFRLLEIAQVRRELDNRYLLTFRLANHHAQIRIDAESSRNPFGGSELRQFRCG